MNTDPTADTPTPDIDAAAPKLAPLPNKIKYSIAALAGALLVATPAMIFSSKPSAPVAAASSTPRQVQVVTLFNCQYLTFTDPFFILHLPKCTNHPPNTP